MSSLPPTNNSMTLQYEPATLRLSCHPDPWHRRSACDADIAAVIPDGKGLGNHQRN